MENIKTAKVKVANVNEVDETTEVGEKKILDRIKESRPVKFARRHWKGLAAGAAVAITAGAVAATAAKNGELDDVPVLDAIGDAVSDAVEGSTDTV